MRPKIVQHCVFVLIYLLVGCGLTQSKPAPVVELSLGQSQIATRKGEQSLEIGLKQYDQGLYKRAATMLSQALESGLPSAKQIIAHKHLAFIYCTSNKLNLCRDEFSKALAVDPRFDLAPAEAGHPQWGPVFRNVKSRQPGAS